MEESARSSLRWRFPTTESALHESKANTHHAEQHANTRDRVGYRLKLISRRPDRYSENPAVEDIQQG